MMEQENNPELSADRLTDDKTPPSVGCRLRERREYLGLGVDDVVAKIKLAHRQIVALEEDDFQALPETAFLRGFVRSYAKLLQMDAQPLLDALPGAQIIQVKAEPIKVDAPFPTTARRHNVSLLLAALFITLGIAGFVLWQARVPHPAVQVPDAALVETPLPLPEYIAGGSSVSEAPESAVVASAPRSVEAVASEVKPASASATAAALRLVFDKESWAEIKDQTGVTLSRQVNPSGSELRVEGVPPFTLVIGHAAAVHLYYREKPVDLTSSINAGSDVARLTLQ